MKKRIIISFSAMLALSPLVAQAAPVTVDFDNLPGGGTIASGTRIDTQYASVGVTFSLTENGAGAGGALASSDFIGGAGTGNGLFNTVGDIFPISSDNRADILHIDFSSGVTNVSFMTEGFSDVTSFDFFDVSGGLLATITNTGGGSMLVSYSGGIVGSIDARQGRDDFAFRIDDLSFTIAAVPEPGSLALLGLGLVGMGFARKRKL